MWLFGLLNVLKRAEFRQEITPHPNLIGLGSVVFSWKSGNYISTSEYEEKMSAVRTDRPWDGRYSWQVSGFLPGTGLFQPEVYLHPLYWEGNLQVWQQGIGSQLLCEQEEKISKPDPGRRQEEGSKETEHHWRSGWSFSQIDLSNACTQTNWETNLSKCHSPDYIGAMRKYFHEKAIYYKWWLILSKKLLGDPLSESVFYFFSPFLLQYCSEAGRISSGQEYFNDCMHVKVRSLLNSL